MPANGLYNIINNAMKAFILTSVLLALPFFTACSQAEKKNTINKQTV